MFVLTPPIWLWARQPAIQVPRVLELLLFAGVVLLVFAIPEFAQPRYLLVAIHLAIALRFSLKWAAAAVSLTSAGYLALAAIGLQEQPLPDLYRAFLGDIAFVFTLNLATYVTAFLHLETESRARRLGELANHLGEVEEHERKRIAHILHDDLQQLFVAAKLKMSAQSDENSERARTSIDCAIDVARTLTSELHPSALEDRTFQQAVDGVADARTYRP